MDLAAFLTPGVHPVYEVRDPSTEYEGPWGHVLCHPDGQITWIGTVPASLGTRLYLTLKVPGYRLGVDGSLLAILEPEAGSPRAPDMIQEAWVVVSGEVRSCSLLAGEFYQLCLEGLVRVLDQ